MPHTRVFTLEGTSVSDGSTESLTESDDESWVIEKVQVFEESGTTLDASTATISIAGDSVTDQSVIVAALQGDFVDIPTMDLEWPSNRTFEFDYTNSSGSAATVNVLLWVTPLSDTGGT